MMRHASMGTIVHLDEGGVLGAGSRPGHEQEHPAVAIRLCPLLCILNGLRSR